MTTSKRTFSLPWTLCLCEANWLTLSPRSGQRFSKWTSRCLPCSCLSPPQSLCRCPCGSRSSSWDLHSTLTYRNSFCCWQPCQLRCRRRCQLSGWCFSLWECDQCCLLQWTQETRRLSLPWKLWLFLWEEEFPVCLPWCSKAIFCCWPFCWFRCSHQLWISPHCTFSLLFHRLWEWIPPASENYRWELQAHLECTCENLRMIFQKKMEEHFLLNLKPSYWPQEEVCECYYPLC